MLFRSKKQNKQKIDGRRNLVGHSPWGRRKSDTTERLHFLSFYSSFWRRKWQPTPAFLPGESHGWRGLVGFSLWGCKELDTTKQLTHTHTHRDAPNFSANERRDTWNPIPLSCSKSPAGFSHTESPGRLQSHSRSDRHSLVFDA